MGVESARAALAAGHNVVATGRDPDTVRSAVGEHENLLVTALDVTDPHMPIGESAVFTVTLELAAGSPQAADVVVDDRMHYVGAHRGEGAARLQAGTVSSSPAGRRR